MLCDNMGPFIRQNKKYTCNWKESKICPSAFHCAHSPLYYNVFFPCEKRENRYCFPGCRKKSLYEMLLFIQFYLQTIQICTCNIHLDILQSLKFFAILYQVLFGENSNILNRINITSNSIYRSQKSISRNSKKKVKSEIGAIVLQQIRTKQLIFHLSQTFTKSR